MRFERINTDPERMGGLPCIRDLRFPVATVVAMVAEGMTFAEILDEHPDLEDEDIREALRYAAEAVRERELPLRRGACGSFSPPRVTMPCTSGIRAAYGI